jgi:phosphoribosylanthranilate isomerase
MGLRTVVKTGCITNLSDARYCAGMGVDFLGFRVIPGQPDAIPVKTFQEIRGWVTGPQIVAEIYGISGRDQLQEILEAYQPDFYELSTAELPLVGSYLTLPFILYLKDGEHLPDLETPPAYVLVNSFNPELMKLIPETEVLVIVNTSEELEGVISQTGITGLSVNGGAELKPGLRDFEDLALILESLEEE